MSESHLDHAPARMLYRSLMREERIAREAQEMAQKAREALTKKTGHGPSPAQIHPDLPRGITCTCGWKTQGGYISDKQFAVGHHVLEEWEKAAAADGA